MDNRTRIDMESMHSTSRLARWVPFYYGWVVVGAVGLTAMESQREVVPAGRRVAPPGSGSSVHDRRHDQGGQHSDDRDHHQHLDERKRPPAGKMSAHHHQTAPEDKRRLSLVKRQ